MRVRLIYKEKSDHARSVREFLYDYEHQTGRSLEAVDPDSIEGEGICRLYDIVEYPTIVATTDDGVLLQLWRGLPLPLINEVSYYDKSI
ncbi:hypothetical protein GX865_03535 [Candidatus Saccharibacteria bacterium]|jgi:hypothetical protein|nr:hypothetical protein [Candidatus Saccharibacteria bacterium]